MVRHFPVLYFPDPVILPRVGYNFVCHFPVLHFQVVLFSVAPSPLVPKWFCRTAKCVSLSCVVLRHVLRTVATSLSLSPHKGIVCQIISHRRCSIIRSVMLSQTYHAVAFVVGRAKLAALRVALQTWSHAKASSVVYHVHGIYRASAKQLQNNTLRYDTIRDAILTCARKPTWVSLI